MKHLITQKMKKKIKWDFNGQIFFVKKEAVATATFVNRKERQTKLVASAFFFEFA